MAELWGDDSGNDRGGRWLSNPDYFNLMTFFWVAFLGILMLGVLGATVGLPLYDLWMRSELR